MHWQARQSIIFEFCASLPALEGWTRLVFASGLFTGNYRYFDPPRMYHSEGAGWVYKALDVCDVPTGDHDHWDSATVTGIAGLLNALLHYGAPPAKEHFRLLLKALSIPSQISKSAAVFFLSQANERWFRDLDFRSIFPHAVAWSSLTHVALELPPAQSMTYIRLGHTLTDISDWHPHIHSELTTWITVFFRGADWSLAEQYNTVLWKIWHPDPGQYAFVDQVEKACGLSLVLLLNAWRHFDLTAEKSVSLLRSTGWTVLGGTYRLPDRTRRNNNTSRFKETFFAPLHDALIQTAAAVRQSISNQLFSERQGVSNRVAVILEDLANKMPITDMVKDRDWQALEREFDEEIDSLERSLRTMSAGISRGS
ncbi:hypothetical protein B0H13DRAFT_2329051 [Mycena leptocephala]|nr:hypothetical protein B0H13DRAFT_2329051 [Mycena leptocephala]